MDRRAFLKTLPAAGVLSLLDPAYLSAGRPSSRPHATQAVPRRTYGRAGDTLSVIGFGGIVVKDVTPADASRFVSEAFERGVTYFDVAADLRQRPGAPRPALAPHRARCFLACKTTEREAAARAGRDGGVTATAAHPTSTCISCTPSPRSTTWSAPSLPTVRWT